MQKISSKMSKSFLILFFFTIFHICVFASVGDNPFLYDDVIITISGKTYIWNFETDPQNMKMRRYLTLENINTLERVQTGSSYSASITLTPNDWNSQIYEIDQFSDGKISAKIFCDKKSGKYSRKQGICLRNMGISQLAMNMYAFYYEHSEGTFGLVLYNGSRYKKKVLSEITLESPLNGWHEISMEAKASRITCYLDDEIIIDCEDNTLPKG